MPSWPSNVFYATSAMTNPSWMSTFIEIVSLMSLKIHWAKLGYIFRTHGIQDSLLDPTREDRVGLDA